MKTTRNFSLRIGETLSRTWRGWLRLENWFANKIKKIIPVTVTKIVLRLLMAAGIVKLLYISGLLSLIGALLTVGVLIVVAAYVLANWTSQNDEMPSDEWDYGPQGYGLYSKNGLRIDGGDEEH